MQFYLKGGSLAFYVGFAAFLSLPIAGYFYAHVLRGHAQEAFVNLMWGRGDVKAAGGIDWWWLKHFLVAAMFGICLAYFRKVDSAKRPFSFPAPLVYAVALFYLVFYLAMGMVMTWRFFWYMSGAAAACYFLGAHLWRYHQASPRGIFLVIGILSFFTVMLGGYVQGGVAGPAFVDRIAPYDQAYAPQYRAPYLMVDVDPAKPCPRWRKRPSPAVRPT